jgi:hypothetical protein
MRLIIHYLNSKIYSYEKSINKKYEFELKKTIFRCQN